MISAQHDVVMIGTNSPNGNMIFKCDFNKQPSNAVEILVARGDRPDKLGLAGITGPGLPRTSIGKPPLDMLLP